MTGASLCPCKALWNEEVGRSLVVSAELNVFFPADCFHSQVKKLLHFYLHDSGVKPALSFIEIPFGNLNSFTQ